MKRALPILLVFVVSACEQEFIDVSHETVYNHIVGKEFIAIRTLRIHAISTDPNYRKEVGFFSVTSDPGIAGPEVIYKRDLKAGTKLKVKAVLKCSNCVFGAPTVVIVDVLSNNEYRVAQVRLYGLKVENERAGNVELDPKYFRVINYEVSEEQ